MQHMLPLLTPSVEFLRLPQLFHFAFFVHFLLSLVLYVTECIGSFCHV